jgi:hypothetical protein
MPPPERLRARDQRQGFVLRTRAQTTLLDDCVPQSARNALWDALDRPTRISVRTTHAGAFLGLTFLRGNHMRHRIVEFLERVLP